MAGPLRELPNWQAHQESDLGQPAKRHKPGSALEGLECQVRRAVHARRSRPPSRHALCDRNLHSHCPLQLLQGGCTSLLPACEGAPSSQARDPQHLQVQDPRWGGRHAMHAMQRPAPRARPWCRAARHAHPASPTAPPRCMRRPQEAAKAAGGGGGHAQGQGRAGRGCGGAAGAAGATAAGAAAHAGEWLAPAPQAAVGPAPARDARAHAARLGPRAVHCPGRRGRWLPAQQLGGSRLTSRPSAAGARSNV
jgi:hypothetical protein